MIDTDNNMDEYQSKYTEQKKADPKKAYYMIPITKSSRRCKLIFSDKKMIRGCLEMGIWHREAGRRC